MKELVLHSKKHGTHTVLYDDEDHDLISKYHWNLYSSKRHHTIYVNSRCVINGKSTTLRFHRIVLSVTSANMQVDHKNGNGLDNRKSNLRICTAVQNGGNQNISIKNTSGFKGVHRNKINGRWIAKVGYNNKKIVLGTFHSIIDAAIAYNNAALKYHGEFARLNQIP